MSNTELWVSFSSSNMCEHVWRVAVQQMFSFFIEKFLISQNNPVLNHETPVLRCSYHLLMRPISSLTMTGK